MALSVGLDTGVSALRAAQTIVDVAAHNIANADTEGYTRQEAALRAIPPVRTYVNGPGLVLNQIGRGVEVERVRRLRDGLIDVQYRDVRGLTDEYHARSNALQQIEVTLDEPSDQGLQALLGRFFNGLREVATAPESIAARSAALEQATNLAAGFNRAARLLTAQQTDLDRSLDVQVGEINARAEEVAALNAKIRIASVAGSPANDLLDRRDLLLDELAGLAGATFEAGPENSVNVLVGGRRLVDNVTVNALATQPDAGNNNLRQVIFASDSAPVTPLGGSLKGIVDSRDVSVAGVLADLDELASSLIAAVNTQHQVGYGLNDETGLTFFTGTGALDIAVDPSLRANPQRLAASAAAGEPGNSANARALAGVQYQPLLNGGTTTIDDGYRAMVAALGVSSRQAQSMEQSQDTLGRHLEVVRQSVSGVSIDEEMTNLVKGQHAYSAAARIITTVDEMLDTLVNRMMR
jgi:flagellar hook-associated protein 1 FlgK